MYNHYIGNTGAVRRVEEAPEPRPRQTPRAVPPQARREEPSRRPLSSLAGLSGELERLLGRLTRTELETEDLLLMLILYLLYRESGDEELLYILAGMFFF